MELGLVFHSVSDRPKVEKRLRSGDDFDETITQLKTRLAVGIEYEIEVLTIYIRMRYNIVYTRYVVHHHLETNG